MRTGVVGGREGADHELPRLYGFDRAADLFHNSSTFMAEHGLQCGYCTPGMIMAAHQLLQRDPHPTEQAIREAIRGNLCRCTGYQRIINALQHAARSRTDWR